MRYRFSGSLFGSLLAIVVMSGLVSSAYADLLGHWNFNDAAERTHALDSSGLGNSGVIRGASYSVNGGRSGVAGDDALDFGAAGNGAHVYLSTAGAGAFDSMTTNNAATISLWINGAAAQPVGSTAFGFYSGNNARQLQSHLPWGDSNIYFDVGGGTTGANRISKPEADSTKWKGQWNHYAFVKNDNTSKIYQNGSHWLSGPTTASIGTIVKGYLGSEVNTTNSYAGLIDDVAVWDEELVATDIAAIAAGTTSPTAWSQTASGGAVVNLSRLGVATQSTTGAGGVAGRAIDGGLGANFTKDASTTHTDATTVGNSWQVDLGGTYRLTGANLFNRGDCCGNRLSNFRVSVLDGLMTEVYGEDFAGPVAQGGSQAFSFPSVEGQYVKVQLNGQNDDNGYQVSLTEVQVFGQTNIPNGANLAALYGTARQSSTASRGAHLAIDGNTRADYAGGSVSHTGTEAAPWWEVDLSANLTLDHINIVERKDGCCNDRINDFSVSVLDEDLNTVYSKDYAAGIPSRENIPLPFDTQGRYVRLQLNNTGTDRVLDMAELQVAGGTLANLARNPLAVATQSSTRTDATTPTGGNDALYAIDGDTNGIFNDGSVTHTLNEPNPWWQVDLNGWYDLDELVLFNRSDGFGGRLSNFHVSVIGLDGVTEVFGQDYYTTGSSVPQGGQLRIPLPEDTIAKLVRIELLGSGNRVLSLAEVQVFGVLAPEPSSLLILALGLIGLVPILRRRRLS